MILTTMRPTRWRLDVDYALPLPDPRLSSVTRVSPSPSMIEPRGGSGTVSGRVRTVKHLVEKHKVDIHKRRLGQNQKTFRVRSPWTTLCVPQRNT